MSETPSSPTENGGGAGLVYRRGNDETPAEGVVTAVSELTGTDPTDMEPLFKVVDPGALNALCRHESRGDQAIPRCVSFQFNDCAVTVYAEDRTAVSRIQ